MRLTCISIEADPADSAGWVVLQHTPTKDLICPPEQPNAGLGLYWYPTMSGPKRAFNCLREAMLAKLQEDERTLRAKIENLKQLEI